MQGLAELEFLKISYDRFRKSIAGLSVIAGD